MLVIILYLCAILLCVPYARASNSHTLELPDLSAIHCSVTEGLLDDDMWCAVGNSGYYLRFPANGNQPSLEETIPRSCAFVDPYALDAPITKSYMDIFGYQGKVRAGRTSADSLAREGRAAQLLDTTSLADAIAEKFWDIFQHVAANPVGRMLLYRIVIEACRRDCRGWPCEEKPSVPKICVRRETKICLYRWFCVKTNGSSLINRKIGRAHV